MPNLKRILCKARFSKQQSFTVTKCKKGNCALCKHLIESGQLQFKNGKTFTVNINMFCDVKTVVYVIRCQRCDEDYVGETRNLRQRVTVRSQQIRDTMTRKIPLSEYLDKCSSDTLKYKIFPFYKLQTDAVVQRRQKETYFIKLYNPKLNRKS